MEYICACMRNSNKTMIKTNIWYHSVEQTSFIEYIASVRRLVLHLATRLSMRGPFVGRAHLWSGSTFSLVLVLFFIPSNAEKSVSHSQVNGKGISSGMAALATLVYENTMADQYADKVFSWSSVIFCGYKLVLVFIISAEIADKVCACDQIWISNEWQIVSWYVGEMLGQLTAKKLIFVDNLWFDVVIMPHALGVFKKLISGIKHFLSARCHLSFPRFKFRVKCWQYVNEIDDCFVMFLQGMAYLI